MQVNELKCNNNIMKYSFMLQAYSPTRHHGYSPGQQGSQKQCVVVYCKEL